MYFHHNGHVAWLSIAKNACRSWEQVFDRLGWQKQDLFRPTVDIEQLEWFGFLRWPAVRHVMGVIEFLEQTDQIDLLHNPQVNRLLVSAVFDQHCYTVSQLVPADIVRRTTWFLIDQQHFNYEQLVKNYLHSHGVDIAVPVPRITNYRPVTGVARTALLRLKQQYPEDNARLEKNFLDADYQLYRRHAEQQVRWHRPGDARPEDRSLSEFYPWLLQEDWNSD